MGHTGRFAVLAVLAVGGSAGLQAPLDSRETLGALPGGGYLVPTNQVVTPIGTTVFTEGVRPKDMAASPDGRTVAVLSTGRVLFYLIDGEPAGSVAIRPGPLGIAWAPDGRNLYASGIGSRIHRIARVNGAWQMDRSVEVQPVDPQTTGLAAAPDGSRLYVGLGTRNSVTSIELPDMQPAPPAASIAAGVCPYSLCIAPDGHALYAANRGGTPARPNAPDSAGSAGTPVMIDRSTDAAAGGTLSVIRLPVVPGETRSATIPVGRQPAGMAITHDGTTLFVANSDSDTVSVVDTQRGRATRTISLRPPEDPGFGQIPTACALSADDKTLYVTCGGANAVAVIAIGPTPKVVGWIPTGWYPIAIAEMHGTLVVASAKGIGARPEHPRKGYLVHSSVGTVQFIRDHDMANLATLSRRVADNNHWGMELATRRGVPPRPVPERVGEPSVFKHVVYIIKENHTYDQDLGDMREGNGDPSLTMFGEQVTPNEHALAREFVLLDNTYTSGTNSADGHQWVDSSVANGYTEQNYSANVRSYPFDGGDALAYSPAGFLWTTARRKGISVRVYGEFVNHPMVKDPTGRHNVSWRAVWDDFRNGTGIFQITAGTDNAALRPYLHPRYVGFPLIVSDQWRASQYIDELKEFEKKGEMPALSILLLPNNHTAGMMPGMPTPRALVADNDLALGRIVEAISHSRFWPVTLILGIEDDSQFGVDHVDGHRTVAFCISPYAKRSAVVSLPYNHTSFTRTIELVLGLPAMTRFDRTAIPLSACFTGDSDARPYIHKPNQIALDEMPTRGSLRGQGRRLAELSRKQDLSGVDRANAGVLARAAWHMAGTGRPFPVRYFQPVRDNDGD